MVEGWVKWPTVQLTLKLGPKPQASRPNIVGQQLPTLLDVVNVLRLFTHWALFHVVCCMGVVAQSLKLVKLLATCKQTQQLTNNVGICCVRLHIA